MGQDDPHALQKKLLAFLRPGHAPQTDLFALSRGQYDIPDGDGPQLFQDRPGRVSKTGATLPLLDHLPKHEGQKAHEDMGFDAVFFLMVERAHVQFVLVDSKGSLDMRELDVDLPDVLFRPIPDIAAQDIAAFGELSPGLLLGIAALGDPKTRWAILNRITLNVKELGCPLITLQKPADLFERLLLIRRFLGITQAPFQTFQTGFNAFGKAGMHRGFFDAPLFAAADQKHIL